MSFARKDVYLPLPSVERGKPVVLGADPKGKMFTYTNGKIVVVRDIENPLVGYTYNEHTAQTTVAKFSPSGFYIASADVSGKVRIWDTTQEEHVLKAEYRPLGGAIKDLAWSPDNQRMVVCGDGRELFAHAFLVDSGSSVGQMAAHSRPVNSIDFKQSRPFRVATASEDKEVGFFQGPPFKRDKLLTEHENFVNAVRFAPDGSKFITVGADGKGFFFDGKDASLIKQLGGDAAPAHSAGIYGVAWSPDGSKVITCSADKTVKMWDVEANTCTATFTFGDSLEAQQLGCLWQGDNIISVGLNGYIYYLDPENPSTPKRVLMGQTKSINAFDVDTANGTFFSGSYDGRTCKFNVATGEAHVLEGGSDSGVTSVSVGGDSMIATSVDDTVRVCKTSSDAFDHIAFKCDSTPNDVSKQGDVSVVACSKEVVLVRGSNKASSLPVEYDAQAVSLAPSGNEVAVGGKDSKIHIYKISGDSLEETKVIDASGAVACLAYSPDGAFLASGDSGRNVFVFEVGSGYELKMDRWKFHTALVNSVAWSPDGTQVASGSLDTNVIVWSMEKPMKRIAIKGAHPIHDVTCVKWLDDSTVATAGRDAAVRTFTITRA